METEYMLFNAIAAKISKLEPIAMPIIAFKLLAALFLIITWTTKLGDGWINAGNPLKKDMRGGLQISEVLKGLAMLALLGSYDIIIDGVEMLLAALSDEMMESLGKFQGSENYLDALRDSMTTDSSTSFFSAIIDFLSPFSPTGLWIQVVYLMDCFIFLFFLARRGFKILIWKLFFPIVFTLYFVDSYKKSLAEYFKEGIRMYLTIIPFLMVNFFCFAVFEVLNKSLTAPTASLGAVGVVFNQPISAIILGFIVLLKLGLYKLSENKLIPSIIK